MTVNGNPHVTPRTAPSPAPQDGTDVHPVGPGARADRPEMELPEEARSVASSVWRGLCATGTLTCRGALMPAQTNFRQSKDAVRDSAADARAAMVACRDDLQQLWRSGPSPEATEALVGDFGKMVRGSCVAAGNVVGAGIVACWTLPMMTLAGSLNLAYATYAQVMGTDPESLSPPVPAPQVMDTAELEGALQDMLRS